MNALNGVRLFGVLIGALFVFQDAAHAAYTITIQQSGANVVASGSGTINTAALAIMSSNIPLAHNINSTNATVVVGGGGNIDQYKTISPPSNFGSTTASATTANSGTGSMFGVNGKSASLYVPTGYVSGTFISGTSQWNTATLSTLKLSTGTYTYTWGSGANADSVIVKILGAPSLSVSATHSSPIFQAGPGTITLTVNNTAGRRPVPRQFPIRSILPSRSTACHRGCSTSSQTVTCTIASGASAASTAFTLNVTASATAAASISNTATLTDSTDTITTGTSNDTIPVNTEPPQADSDLSQTLLSGSTDNGLCAAGNMTLTATDLVKNTSGSTLTNPYAVISTLSGGNSLLSESVNASSVASNRGNTQKHLRSTSSWQPAVRSNSSSTCEAIRL